MNVESIIAPRKIEDIKRIYIGLDHNCRCGCRGKYHDAGTKGFKLALAKMRRTEPLKEGDMVYVHEWGNWRKTEGVTHDRTCVNIPYDENDKCFTVYFE